MVSPASSLIGVVYKKILKPQLFKRPPDEVHDRMVTAAWWHARHPFIMPLVRVLLSYRSPRLQQVLHGITFNNVVGLSAGLDKNAQMPVVCEAVGFGMIEVGTMTAEPCSGNPRPWFQRLKNTQSIAVHAGLANQGVTKNLQRLGTYKPRLWQNLVLNVSVGKTNNQTTATDEEAIADYCIGINRVLDAQLAKMITINISCPNTYGGEPFTDASRLAQLLNAVAALQPTIPVAIKMPIDKSWEEFKSLLDVLERYDFIKFVTIGNLAKNRSAINFKDPVTDSLKGNFSGKPTWELSNELIRQTYRHFHDRFTIIGVGGIFTPAEAYTKITLGASLVQIATGLVFEGPQLAGQINQYIDRQLAKNNKSLQDIIGIHS